MKDHMSLPEFYKRFPDEEACQEFIIQERWNGKPHCPHCGNTKVYRIVGKMPFKCGGCRKKFSVRTGSVLASSKVSLQTWLLAIYIMTTARKGISSVQFAKELGVTQKTAWFLEHRIREACAGGKGVLSGEVEVDEAYLGGKRRNMSNARRKALAKEGVGRGAVGKQPVVGLKERSGAVRAMPVDETDKPTLHRIINEHVDPSATVYTDEATAYSGIPHRHETVRHSASEYVNGKASTNGIESFWALLKRGYVGTHHWWSMHHTHRYVAEYEYRQNTIGLSGESAIGTLLRKAEGKRLDYASLIA